MEIKIRGARIWVEEERDTEDAEGSTLEETLNDLITKRAGRVQNSDLGIIKNEEEKELEKELVETSKGETLYLKKRSI